MSETLREVFSAQHFIQHGHCYLWKPGLIGLEMLSNLLTALVCFTAAAVLTVFTLRQGGQRSRRFLVPAALFLLGCGLTHLMNVVVVWSPLYWIDGGLRALTALAGVAAVLRLPRMLATQPPSAPEPPRP